MKKSISYIYLTICLLSCYPMNIDSMMPNIRIPGHEMESDYTKHTNDELKQEHKKHLEAIKNAKEAGEKWYWQRSNEEQNHFENKANHEHAARVIEQVLAKRKAQETTTQHLSTNSQPKQTGMLTRGLRFNSNVPQYAKPQEIFTQKQATTLNNSDDNEEQGIPLPEATTENDETNQIEINKSLEEALNQQAQREIDHERRKQEETETDEQRAKRKDEEYKQELKLQQIEQEAEYETQQERIAAEKKAAYEEKQAAEQEATQTKPEEAEDTNTINTGPQKLEDFTSTLGTTDTISDDLHKTVVPEFSDPTELVEQLHNQDIDQHIQARKKQYRSPINPDEIDDLPTDEIDIDELMQQQTTRKEEAAKNIQRNWKFAKEREEFKKFVNESRRAEQEKFLTERQQLIQQLQDELTQLPHESQKIPNEYSTEQLERMSSQNLTKTLQEYKNYGLHLQRLLIEQQISELQQKEARSSIFSKVTGTVADAFSTPESEDIKTEIRGNNLRTQTIEKILEETKQRERFAQDSFQSHAQQSQDLLKQSNDELSKQMDQLRQETQQKIQVKERQQLEQDSSKSLTQQSQELLDESDNDIAQYMKKLQQAQFENEQKNIQKEVDSFKEELDQQQQEEFNKLLQDMKNEQNTLQKKDIEKKEQQLRETLTQEEKNDFDQLMQQMQETQKQIQQQQVKKEQISEKFKNRFQDEQQKAQLNREKRRQQAAAKSSQKPKQPKESSSHVRKVSDTSKTNKLKEQIKSKQSAAEKRRSEKDEEIKKRQDTISQRRKVIQEQAKERKAQRIEAYNKEQQETDITNMSDIYEQTTRPTQKERQTKYEQQKQQAKEQKIIDDVNKQAENVATQAPATYSIQDLKKMTPDQIEKIKQAYEAHGNRLQSLKEKQEQAEQLEQSKRTGLWKLTGAVSDAVSEKASDETERAINLNKARITSAQETKNAIEQQQLLKQESSFRKELDQQQQKELEKLLQDMKNEQDTLQKKDVKKEEQQVREQLNTSQQVEFDKLMQQMQETQKIVQQQERQQLLEQHQQEQQAIFEQEQQEFNNLIKQATQSLSQAQQNEFTRKTQDLFKEQEDNLSSIFNEQEQELESIRQKAKQSVSQAQQNEFGRKTQELLKQQQAEYNQTLKEQEDEFKKLLDNATQDLSQAKQNELDRKAQELFDKQNKAATKIQSIQRQRIAQKELAQRQQQAKEQEDLKDDEPILARQEDDSYKSQPTPQKENDDKEGWQTWEGAEEPFAEPATQKKQSSTKKSTSQPEPSKRKWTTPFDDEEDDQDEWERNTFNIENPIVDAPLISPLQTSKQEEPVIQKTEAQETDTRKAKPQEKTGTQKAKQMLQFTSTNIVEDALKNPDMPFSTSEQYKLLNALSSGITSQEWRVKGLLDYINKNLTDTNKEKAAKIIDTLKKTLSHKTIIKNDLSQQYEIIPKFETLLQKIPTKQEIKKFKASLKNKKITPEYIQILAQQIQDPTSQGAPSIIKALNDLLTKEKFLGNPRLRKIKNADKSITLQVLTDKEFYRYQVRNAIATKKQAAQHAYGPGATRQKSSFLGKVLPKKKTPSSSTIRTSPY